jgi:hypothetical protein
MREKRSSLNCTVHASLAPYLAAGAAGISPLPPTLPDQFAEVLVRLGSDLGQRVKEPAQSHRNIEGLAFGMEQRRVADQIAVGSRIHVLDGVDMLLAAHEAARFRWRRLGRESDCGVLADTHESPSVSVSKGHAESCHIVA